MTTENVKVRDLPPVSVRLPPELRHALAREAAINGRSLHGEVLHRLRTSFFQDLPGAPGVAAEPPSQFAQPLADTERVALTLFKRLSPEKQLALLSLLK